METNSQMDNGRLAYTDENILRRLIFKVEDWGAVMLKQFKSGPELLMGCRSDHDLLTNQSAG